MKNWRRTLRRLGFIILMLLAAVAVGVTGSAPVIPKKRENYIVIEVVQEMKEQESQTNLAKLGQEFGE